MQLAKEYHIGFTGTRLQLTPKQIRELELLLVSIDHDNYDKRIICHHGDCIGADTEFHYICRQRNFYIVIHPPDNPKYRANLTGYTDIMPKLPYLMRNKDIVNNSDIIIACPRGKEQLRSGTWSTIRYAKKMNKPIHIINNE